MTPEFWKHIHPQLEEQVSQELTGYTAEELLDILNIHNWHKQRPFDSFLVWYTDETDYPITQWIIQAEAHTGDEATVYSGFREKLKLIIEYQWALRQKEPERKVA